MAIIYYIDRDYREAIDVFGRPLSDGQKVSVSLCGSVAKLKEEKTWLNIKT